jgi:hypothetical protein
MYSIDVKIDDFEKRKRSSSLLHVAIGLFLLIKSADYYKYLLYENFLPVAPLLIVASLSLFYGLFRKKLDVSGNVNFWLRCLQVAVYTALGVLLIEKGTSFEVIVAFVFAFFCLVLIFNERRIFNETVILLNEEGITVPGYYKEHRVNWKDVERVVIREDFITIFHIRQKYLQFQVMQDLSTLELAKLNAFCKEMVERSVADRKMDY